MKPQPTIIRWSMRLAVLMMAITVVCSTPVIHAADQTKGGGYSDDTISTLLNDTADFGGYDVQNTNETTVSTIAGRITFSALTLIGLLFISFTVYAGYLWMTARGNSDQTKKAKEILENSVMGLFIIFAAYALTSLVYQALVQYVP